MSTSAGDHDDDPDRVRLVWPGGGSPRRESSEPGPAPRSWSPTGVRAVPVPPPVSTEPMAPDGPVEADPPAATIRAEPAVAFAASRPDPSFATDALVPPRELGFSALDASGLRRAIVDAYDRLADQITARIRHVHDDLGSDVADLRGEIAKLRESVEDLQDRQQQRSIRVSLDELRSDVAALRRELQTADPIDGEVRALRADVQRLADRPGRESGPTLAQLAPLVEEITRLQTSLPSMDPVLDELAELREEVARLRRRLTLRAELRP